MLWWILFGAVIVGYMIWSHIHECSELSVGVAFERSRVLRIAGSGALIFCLYECVEVAVTGAWFVPTFALYQRCTALNAKYLQDIEQMRITPDDIANADANAAQECSQRLSTLGQIGVSIMTHGHDH